MSMIRFFDVMGVKIVFDTHEEVVSNMPIKIPCIFDLSIFL